MKIWANTVVNNEENFIWFAIMSVVDHIDKVLVWDTGSTDKTVEIIREIKKLKGDKVDFKEVGSVDEFEFPKVRQQMLDQSDCDWILILDGDEIWWEASIKNLRKTIDEKGNEIDGVVIPMKVAVGDIYHMQDESAGQYELLGRKGHLSLRAIRKIPNLHVDWPYGRETYLDENNLPVQERENIIFLDAPYLHVTHLKRSAKLRRFDKFKYEMGRKISKDFKFPESLYLKYPPIVPSPWIKISGAEKIKSQLLTPLRKINRRTIMSSNNDTQTLESMSQAVWYNQWTLKKFENYLKGDILEVGCGIGNFTKYLQKYGVIWAIDVDESYVKQTSSKVGEKTRVGLGDIEKGKYFFKEKKFDSIVCLNVLEHIKDDHAALANMYKLLNDGGYLILLVPALNYLYGEIDKSIGHFRRYNREDLHKLINTAGFKIIKSRIINFLGGLGWWISSKVLSSSKVSIGKIKVFSAIAPFVLPLENLFEPPIGTSILLIARK